MDLVVRESGRDLPAFDEGSFVDGRRSLLSLGEGKSHFIGSLLERREKQIAVDGGARLNILAVDVYYRSFTAFIERIVRRGSPQSRYSTNYRSSRFQDRDLRDENGQHMLFDEIISSWSMNFIVERTNGIELQALYRALAHLKPGGVIRVWPITNSVWEPIIERLYAEGLISDHINQSAPYSRSKSVANFVMLRKKQ
jgi:hypothetical protein